MSTDRFVCPPDHQHAAKTTCYHVHRCRCAPCQQADQENQRRRRKLIAYGRWAGLRDATMAREHLQLLAATGIGQRRAAKLAGIGYSQVRAIAHGVTKRVTPATEQKILGVPVDRSLLADGAFIPATGTQRRIQALAARGYPMTHLADELGMHVGNLSRILHQKVISVALARRIAEAYERLWNAPLPGSTKAQKRQRTRAAAHGWLPPLAWDDIDTDPHPPAAAPEDHDDDIDTVAIDLAVEGNRVDLTTDERRIAVAELTARKYSAPEIALLLGVTSKTIERDRATLAAEQSEEVAA